ncbi:cation-independent mannose-6-phosphate receptor-like isoform X1 [Cotesia glomerata]|nr:cation-independent mannose-6-phosphate receptor-like isoform X1 [Cotesia glomerata]
MGRLIILVLLASECYFGECNKQVIPPSYCEIDLGVHALKFDFRKLSEVNDDYILKHESTNETIKFQLCKPLKKTCNEASGVAGCLIRGNEEIILGKVPEVQHEDGRISFSYVGEKCGDKFYYTFNVIMMCDSQAEYSYPELFPYDQKQCNFIAVWKTKLACGVNFEASEHSVDCKVTDEKTKTFYDLGSLKKTSDNYIVHIDNKSSIILNVCHTVVFGSGVVCPFSAACLRNSTNSITYSSIGDVSSPKIVNGSVTLTYSTGALCADMTHSDTTISFVCDFKAYETQPALGQLKDDCHYNVIWKTIAACDNKKAEEYKQKTSASCKFTNPITNYEYNLDSLKGEDYIVRSANDEYKFSVCGPLLTNFCKKGNDDSAGVCSAHNRIVGGKANSKLISTVGGLYLNYTDGSSCQGNRSRFTIIAFRCSPEGSDAVPIITEESTCHLVIQWNTSLACEKKVSSSNYERETKIKEPVIKQSADIINQASSFSASKVVEASTDDDKHTKGNSYVTGIVIVSILVGSSIFLAVCFLNAKVQECVKSCLRCRFLKKSDVRMRYSKISTSSEADALLDGPDTMCQSDSDDDLLRL